MDAREPTLSTIPRAARELGIPERTIYAWVKSWRVQSWRVANAVTLVDVDQLAHLAAARGRGNLPSARSPQAVMDPAAVMASAVEWDTTASVHWTAGRGRLFNRMTCGARLCPGSWMLARR